MNYQEGQSFDVGMTLIEIAECVKEFNATDYTEYNGLTKKEQGRKLFAPLEYGEGVDRGKVSEIWKVTQSMDDAAYATLNYLLTGKAYFFVPPPPPPPPPGGDG